MAWWTLWACTMGGASPEVTPERPSYEAVLRVQGYREVDLAKGPRPALYVRAELEVLSGDEGMREHAVSGIVKVYGSRERIAEVAELPWAVGSTLSVKAQPRGDGLIDLLWVKRLP